MSEANWGPSCTGQRFDESAKAIGLEAKFPALEQQIEHAWKWFNQNVATISS